MPETSPVEKPFLIEHHQLDHRPGGTFRPAARLVLQPALRTSGLWAVLPPDDFKNLILLLTFLSPNGNCRTTLPELADAMHVPLAKAQSRLERLTQHQWQSKPLAIRLTLPGAADTYLPSRHLLADEQVAPPEPHAVPVQPTASFADVVAHSRALYARPREEVEQGIAERMGWEPPAFAGEDPAVAEQKQREFVQMTNLGMPRDQALDLLTRFDLARVERQLAWLPARRAKSPARFLAAAIEGDYERPQALLRQALLEAALKEQRIAEEHSQQAQSQQEQSLVAEAGSGSDASRERPAEAPPEAGSPPEDVSTLYQA